MSMVSTKYLQYEFEMEGNRVKPGNILILKNYRKVVFMYLLHSQGRTYIIGQQGDSANVRAFPVETLRGLFKPKRSRRHKTYE